MMMPITIKAVVLDLGEVLIRLDFSKVMDALGLPPHQPIAEWLKNMDAWQDYDKFERGALTEADFFSARPEIKAVWNTVLKSSVPQIEAILGQLKKKTNLFALTNTNATHLAHALERFPLLRAFERVFSSHEIGARKPEEKIYRFVEQSIGLSGPHILFVDDREENVEGARRIGWNAELCKESPTDLLAVLEKYGLVQAGDISPR